MSFSNLKKQSSLGSLTAKLVKEVEKQNNTGGGADERLWKPEMDKVTVTQSSASSLPLKAKIFLGQNCTPTPSKVLVVGTSRTL